MELKEVSKNFGGIRAVDRLSFSLEEGKISSLIGPNGAGKTTIFNIITGFLTPDEGAVYYRSKRMTGLPPHAIARSGVARSFQDLRLFNNMTVLDNVLLAMPDQPGENVFRPFFTPKRVAAAEKANKDKALSLLEFVHLADKSGEIADDLAYGEQKLLAIARLLASEGNLLLLDEPTSGLDPNTVEAMLGLLRQLIDRGKTILLIEHNLNVVKEVSDWIVFLNFGQMVTSGRPEEIMSDPRLAELYFGQTMSVISHVT